MKLFMKVHNYHRFSWIVRQSAGLQSTTKIQPSAGVYPSRYYSTKSEQLFAAPPKNEIAIIGAGISGLGVLRGIMSQLKVAGNSENILSQYGNVSIHVFEKEKTLGNGYPYSSEHMEPEHLINMPLDSMSLYPNDFNHWLEQNNTQIRQYIEHIFTLRFQKEFYKLFGEPFDLIHLEHYKERFGDTFLQLYKKNKDAYLAFESRYLCVSDPQFYAPRIVYGMYLRDRFLETVNFLKTLNVTINLHPNTEVVDIHKEEQHIRLLFNHETKANNKIFCFVVIATGHWSPKDLNPATNYFTSWSAPESMRQINRILQRLIIKKTEQATKSPITAKIAILGASLSAIDTIKVLFQGGVFTRDSCGNLVFTPPHFLVRDNAGIAHTAQITVDILSRNGLMPKVRGQYGRYINTHLTKKNIQLYLAAHEGKITLAQVMQLLKNDLENAYMAAGLRTEINWENILSPTHRGFKQLKKDMDKAVYGDAEQGLLVWQTVYHQASDLFIEIYKHLPAEDKLNFDLFLRTQHFVHIAPMPQSVAEELIAMHHSGVLEARILGASTARYNKADDDHIEFVDIDGKTHTYDATIVATGQNNDVTQNPAALFRNIIKRELLTTLHETVTHKNVDSNARFFKTTHHPANTQYNTGQVLRTPNMELINGHNVVQKNIYIVGVASSTFGISRASRSVMEGHMVGVNIVKNMVKSIPEEAQSVTRPHV